MKNLIIIGARGFGRTLHEYLKEDIGNNVDFRIVGFLDDKVDVLDKFKDYPPIISSVENYEPQEADIFLCSLGDVKCKKKYSEIIINKGGTFYTFVHPSARVIRDAIIGEGAIIAPYSTIGSAAIIGDHCLIQAFSVIAHDVNIGAWSRIDTHAICTGNSKVGIGTTIHTGAILNQFAEVGSNSSVGAGCFVLKRVPDNSTVYGNPAKLL